MGILKKDADELTITCTPFQLGVLDILDEYDYEILDLRYIEDYKQVVVTLNGLVMFVTEADLTLSFEISMTPEQVSNLVLILSETISPKAMHVTDSFIITKDAKGNNVAVFGPDAKTIYEHEIAKARTTNPKYLQILMNPNVKFYKC